MIDVSRLRTLIMTSMLAFATANRGWTAESARVWTDASGKHKTTAEFVSADEQQVILRKPGTKKTLTMKLSRLSEEDREYVKQRIEALKSEATAEDSADSETVTEPPANSEADESSPDIAPPTARPTRSPNVANSVRNAVLRAVSRDQMRQIAIALTSYEAERGKFPQSNTLKSNDGKSGLSWRVAILPMIDENALYQQFHLQEPWDSPHNKALIARIPKIFQSPGSGLEKGYTNYLGITGPNTVLNDAKRPTKAATISDGTSHTIMIVEADDTHAVIWTRPEDYPWDVANPSVGLGNIWSGSFFAAMADGSVHFIPAGSLEMLNGLFSTNGGEVVQLDE